MNPVNERGFVVRTLGGLTALLVFLPFGAAPHNGAWANPFQMRVVDHRTGEGIADARLTSDTGVVCYTRADGSVRWTESELMDRDATFRIDTSGARRTVVMHVQPGGYAEVRIQR